jgi:serine O-acetyltransferase
MENIRIFIEELYKDNTAEECYMPGKEDANYFCDSIIKFMFPLNVPKDVDEYMLRYRDTEVLFRKLLYTLKKLLKEDADKIIRDFFNRLPVIYRKLRKDAISIYNFDPAAASVQEVVNAYPGFFAISVYRIAHQLVQQGVPVLPRMIAEHAHSVTGIDINPGATIGDDFFIDHGTGVVIGETTDIGNNVKIYQGVTLGALTVEKSLASTKRHPTIEDNVIIYAGSTVLGGKTVIGRDSVIGGNVWLTESVPPNSIVYHKSEVKIKTNKLFNEPINYVI